MNIEKILKKLNKLEKLYMQNGPIDNCWLSDLSITFQTDLSGTINFSWMPCANSGIEAIADMVSKSEDYYETQIIFESLKSLTEILEGKIENESHYNTKNTAQ